MVKILPKAKDKRWIGTFILIDAIITTIFILGMTLILHESFHSINTFWITFIPIVVSAVICIAGYLAYRALSITLLMGAFIGLVFMIYYFLRGYELDDLLGGIIFVYTCIIALIVGIIIQIGTCFISRKRLKR